MTRLSFYILNTQTQSVITVSDDAIHPVDMYYWACILIQVAIYRRLRIGRDDHENTECLITNDHHESIKAF